MRVFYSHALDVQDEYNTCVLLIGSGGKLMPAPVYVRKAYVNSRNVLYVGIPYSQ
jgi:hypothetical protein